MARIGQQIYFIGSQAPNKDGKKEADDIGARIARHPNSLLGIYKHRSKRDSQDVGILARGNRFNTSHSLAKSISGGGRMPDSRRISLGGVRAEEPGLPAPTEAESVLHHLRLRHADRQWDRFSGGNIEAYAHKCGRLQFIARDNGGANLLWG